MSSRAVEKQISRLKELGRLQRRGSARGGHWKIVADSHLNERAKRGNPQRFKEILAQAPNVPPDDGDRLD